MPRDRYLAENRSAFAILDAFPVTEGHALVIPRRLISTWWEASPDERADLIALVDEVKALLDERHSPDGYNMGFNAGTAAGQTVDHLHLHVIPRRDGDVADPRGGIRHVIPGKGNYLAAPTGADPTQGTTGTSREAPDPTALLIDGLEQELLPFLQAALADQAHDRIDIVVSFVKRSGIELVLPDLREAVDRGAHLRLLTTDYLGITEPAALEQLHDLAGDHPDRVTVKVHRAGQRSFHPKAYIFSSGTDPDVARSYVGSSNLTRSGLTGGIEWNVGFEAVDATRRSFQTLWDDPASQPLDRDLLDHLESLPRPTPIAWRRDGTATPPPPVEPEDVHIEDDETEPITPHEIQRDALDALAATRAEGNAAGLVVMATGLGKTYLAAFDCLATGAERVLFVAHREEILTQSRDAFRRVIPTASMGLFTGTERDPGARFVFASVQSLANHLDRFPADRFDYIVVDEFHHAAASSYRTVLDHFRPGFLLGLTATPERMDGASILSLCNDNLVYACDLVEGIKRGRLATFRYHGLSDPTDYAVIPWRSGRFVEGDLEVALATEERARAVFDGWRERAAAGSRTLAFCVTQLHADFMAQWFREQGVRAVAVHSGPSSAPRTASVRELDAGELDVLFAVDVFNEGLDVPSIDTVMMLRPTSSPVIFLQQLGRGLRLLEDKSSVTVIDMIGNHQSFLLRPRVLLAMTLGRVPTNREVLDAMRTGTFSLPVGCEVDFDLQVVDFLSELVASRARGTDLLAEYVRSHLDEEGRRPTKTQAFRAGLNPSRSATKSPWFEFLAEHGALDEGERDAVLECRDVLSRFEVVLTSATKSYKMVTLRALSALGALRSGTSLREVVERSRSLMLGDPRLLADVRSASVMPDPHGASLAEWETLWRLKPIDALTTPSRGEPPLFSVSGDRLVPTFRVDEEHGEAFDALVAELVDYRLARYLADRPALGGDGPAERVLLKVSHTGGRPILFLDRDNAPGLPEGSNIAIEIDGERHRGDFRRVALNVVRRESEEDNRLPEVLRGWFGPNAGHPGTRHRVVAEPRGEYWALAPEGSGSGLGSLEQFVGEWFRRESVPELFGTVYNTGNWNSGHVSLEEDTVLFVTLKGGEYANRMLDPGRLHWFSQNSASPDSKKGREVIEHEDQGRTLQVFLRSKKGEFLYAGPATYVSHSGSKPIEFELALDIPLSAEPMRDLGIEV